VNGENGDLVGNSHNILIGYKNYFCQLLNLRGANDIKWTEMHTSEQLVPESSSFEIQIAIKNMKYLLLRSSNRGCDELSMQYVWVRLEMSAKFWSENQKEKTT
jgi:hypothetical protein